MLMCSNDWWTKLWAHSSWLLAHWRRSEVIERPVLYEYKSASPCEEKCLGWWEGKRFVCCVEPRGDMCAHVPHGCVQFGLCLGVGSNRR